MDAKACEKASGTWNPRLKECWKGGELVLKYPKIGIVYEAIGGMWGAKDCTCSGYIDENYDAVITYVCKKHTSLKSQRFLPGDLPSYKRIKW